MKEKFDFTKYGTSSELFSFVFWEKLKTQKRHFKINRPLAGSNQSDRAPSWLSKSIGIVTVRAINLCCQQKKPKPKKSNEIQYKKIQFRLGCATMCNKKGDFCLE